MKKVISAILAGAMCAGAFTACGDKKDDKKSSGLSTKCDGEYVSITPLDGQKQPFIESIDEGIKYSVYLAEEYEKENDDEYNPHLIKFSGDEFLMPIMMGADDWLYYDGTFSVKNGKIKFSYENYLNPKLDFKVNINDEVEYDPDIAAGTKSSDDLIEISAEDEWLENVDSYVRDELISMGTITFGELKKNNYKYVYRALREYHIDKSGIAERRNRMQQLNETGSYFQYVLPSMNYSDKWSDFSILPFIRYVNSAGYFNYEYPNPLYTVDDFLCTDAYGIELDGKYKRGKDFTLKHDLEDTLENDEQSYYKGRDDAEELIDKTIERAKLNYDCDDLETTIEFSDGEWEWFNADGGLINNGRYDESKDYPGLVMMYVDEDSKNYPDYAINCPLWFYIADDGEIYYPGYVKMD